MITYGACRGPHLWVYGSGRNFIKIGRDGIDSIKSTSSKTGYVKSPGQISGTFLWWEGNNMPLPNGLQKSDCVLLHLPYKSDSSPHPLA